MRILFVADGRSPIALNWMEHFTERGYEVHLASSFDAKPQLKLASFTFVPVALSAAASVEPREQRRLRQYISTRTRTRLRQWLGPLTLGPAARQLRQLAKKLEPDLVHALRIPFEGMLAARADLQAPLLVSVWGNDFTLHARSSLLMGRATRQTLKRASALLSDTQRDQKLAVRWGYAAQKPSLVLPGNGGVRTDIFYPLPGATHPNEAQARLQVINPRGMRAYVRNDVFFQAIPHVLRKRPEVRFLCPDMEGEPEAERWVRELKIESYVQLMPRMRPKAMADSYHASQVMVSPSTHDGTPNTLLEAMSSGCFPVLGDIESVREWIRDGDNGLLVDPSDPKELAKAIIQALKDTELRRRAAKINAELIRKRADYKDVMQRAESFYAQIIR